MSFLSGWVISIVGIVVLGVLVDVIITDGQTAKYIKSVFAIITVFVIAAPIPKLIHGDIPIENIFGSQQDGGGTVDEKYLDYLFDLQVESINSEVWNMVEGKGHSVYSVDCNAERTDGKFSIKSIKIVMNGTVPHINIVNGIVQEVATKYNIAEQTVSVNGRE